MLFTLGAFIWIDWAVLGLYLAVVVGIGLWTAGRSRDADTYFLAGRSMPAWAVAMSLLATSLSAATFIGAPVEAFAGDLSYLILNVGQILGVLVVAFFFLPVLYRAGTITVYGYLGQRFGPGAKTATSIAFLVGRLLASGSRLFIAGIAFSLILYGDIKLANLLAAILLFGVVGTLYTACGGIRAVIWTDTLQIVIVVGAALLSVVLLLRAIPLSVGEIVDVLRAETPSKFRLLSFSRDPAEAYTLWTALAMTLFAMAAFGTDQDLIQRMLTCKSARQSSWSLIGGILIGIPVTLLFLIIGLLLYVYYARPDVMGAAAPADALADMRQVYPQYLLHHLPAGLTGLAMAGLFAAAMSSLDSAINAMASTVVGDLLPTRRGRSAGSAGRGETRDATEPTSQRYAELEKEGVRAGPDLQGPASAELRTSRRLVVLIGAALTATAILAAVVYDPERDTLIAFALGVMTFAYAGLLGVFLTALFTRRGNTATVIAALVAGAAVITVCRWLPDITTYLLGQPYRLAFAWWMVLGTAASFIICVAGTPGTVEKGASIHG